MSILQFANNASTTLAQPITGVSTTIYVAAGTGSKFPQPVPGYNFLATIYNTSSTLDEVVLVTARSGDQLTVVRAQEGTIAQTWIVGDTIGMYPTKGTMEKLLQNDQFQNGKYSVSQAAGTANALTCQIPSDLTSVPDGMTIIVKPVYANTGAATLQVTLGSTVLPAVPIVKGYNLAITANDIPSAGYPVQLIYSAIYNAWVMQMPATLISPPAPPTYTINYVAVGGGGGAYDLGSSGNWNSGGAGGGNVVASSLTGLVGNTLTITIGGGGSPGANGSATTITGVVSSAGGLTNPQQLFNAAGGASGNGNAGGSGVGDGGGGTGQGGGGGGGAGAVGQSAGYSAPYFVAGQGGDGISTSISGIPTYYGGGGGGGSYNGPAAGGAGGGGAGSTSGGTSGNGSINSGGGGGGHYGTGNGGSGGSGRVILSIPTSSYTGVFTGAPTVTTNGSYTILTYNNSGTYTI